MEVVRSSCNKPFKKILLNLFILAVCCGLLSLLWIKPYGDMHDAISSRLIRYFDLNSTKSTSANAIPSSEEKPLNHGKLISPSIPAAVQLNSRLTVPVKYPPNRTDTVDVSYSRRETNANVTGEIVLGSRAKSIAFIKAYKVGGTTFSSILSAYAFDSNLVLGGIAQWCSDKSFKIKDHCVDVIGTNHPPKPCRFPKSDSPSFCNPAEVFMLIRDPVDRLWSGYQHMAKTAGSEYSLEAYLKSKSLTLIPPHQLLHMYWKEAIKAAENINLLLTERYDESLVYMAIKAGLKLCDILYVPCKDSVDWGTAKCNPNKRVMAKTEVKLLEDHAKSTGEDNFFKAVYNQTLAKLRTPDVEKLTAKYRLMRSKVLAICQRPEIIKQVENYLENHPYTKKINNARKGKAPFYHWHLLPETVHVLDPVMICLGWHCRE